MRSGALGSASAAVPTATRLAPASRYSRASRPLRTPPTPITGSWTFSVTLRVASTPMGRSAGPLTPPNPVPSLPASAPDRNSDGQGKQQYMQRSLQNDITLKGEQQ